jgi:hypothetical protein
MFRHVGNRIVEGIKRNKYGNEIPTRKTLLNLLQRETGKYEDVRDRKLPTPFYHLFLNRKKLAGTVNALNGKFPLDED